MFLNLSVLFYVTKPLIQIEKMKSIVIETFSSCVIHAMSWQDMYGCIPFFRSTISLNVSDSVTIRYKNDYSTLGWKTLWLKSPLMKVYHNFKIITLSFELSKEQWDFNILNALFQKQSWSASNIKEICFLAIRKQFT